jgi:hypothetical protein
MSDTDDSRNSKRGARLDGKLEVVLTYEERVAADRRDARRAAREAVRQLEAAHDNLNRAALSRVEAHRASRV